MMQEWFSSAKLGIFVHWGIYSAGDWGESWPFFNGDVPYDAYMAQAKTFTAAKYGDYGTPEQAIPIQAPKGPWEFCVTINDSWGYQKKDRNFKSARQCVRMLAACAGMGGNLLLDVGPRSDGTILPEQVEVLQGLGRWMARNSEAFYGVTAGLPHGHFYGASTLSTSRESLYLFSGAGDAHVLT